MTNKYNIEGDIDFFSELYKSLDFEDDNNDENKCLITNQNLTDRFVKLKCGHSFNYLPLLQDIKNHKVKFNNMEGTHTKLKNDELRCPYCRKKQNELLPYYEDLYPEKINGVNCLLPFLETNNIWKYKPYGSIEGVCQFVSNGPLMPCCPSIFVYNLEDGKTYCYEHKKIMTKQILYDIALKKKEALKQAKIKEKEALKQAKIKEKEALKQAKIKEKEALWVKTVVGLFSENNELIENNEIIGCTEILKYGENKGNKCNKSIFENNLCKRHFSKLNKETI
jgi:hypothetical protein